MTISKKQLDLINGSLLGDGSLSPRKNRPSSRFSILRKLSDLPYLEWEYEILSGLCKTGIKTKEIVDKRTDKTYSSCYFATRASDELTAISKKWYANGYKCVPKDINLTPLCLGVWILDDGNIRFTSSEIAGQLTFATNSFSKEEVDFLAEKLQVKFEEYFGVYPNNNGFVISCSTKAMRKIFAYVAPIIPASIMPRKTKFFGIF